MTQLRALRIHSQAQPPLATGALAAGQPLRGQALNAKRPLPAPLGNPNPAPTTGSPYVTQNQIANTPADTLIPGNNTGQALGIFRATGNIKLNNKQSNGNLEIDASRATVSAGGSGGLVNTGNAINILNIVGGRIQSTIQNINTTTRNVYFDRRFAPGSNFAPPWFPSTSLSGTIQPANYSVSDQSVQRVSWVASPQ